MSQKTNDIKITLLFTFLDDFSEAIADSVAPFGSFLTKLQLLIYHNPHVSCMRDVICNSHMNIERKKSNRWCSDFEETNPLLAREENSGFSSFSSFHLNSFLYYFGNALNVTLNLLSVLAKCDFVSFFLTNRKPNENLLNLKNCLADWSFVLSLIKNREIVLQYYAYLGRGLRLINNNFPSLILRRIHVSSELISSFPFKLFNIFRRPLLQARWR